MRALVTNMDIPLGYHIGNSLEVMEAVRILRGEQKGDLYEICVALSANLVSMLRGCPAADVTEAVVSTIESGAAFEKMKQWIAAQGGDVAMIEDTTRLPLAPHRKELYAPRDGCIAHMNTEQIGLCASLLGAGRVKKDDCIDYGAGIVLTHKTGDRVHTGDCIATLYTSDRKNLEEAGRVFLSALTFSDTEIDKPTLIYRG